MPPCIASPGGSLTCGWPVGAPYGWTVEPTEIFKSTHGNGGVFFQYGAGRVESPSLPGYPGIPNNTALYFQVCDVVHEAGWCEGIASVISETFAISGAHDYRLAVWARSTTFLATTTPQENRLFVDVSFLDAAGALLGVNRLNFTPNSAPMPWTENILDITAPANATSARISINAARYRQSNVYVDDVRLVPL